MSEGWPKDTHPKVIERAKQVSSMSLDQAKAALMVAKHETDLRMDRRVQADPIAKAILEIIVGSQAKGGASKRDALETLRLFFCMFHEADALEKRLESTEEKARSGVLREFSEKWKVAFPNREIFADDMLLTYCSMPMIVAVDLKLGIQSTHEKWPNLTKEEREKFVWDVFDTDKGYPKAVRSVPEWRPPRLLDVRKVLKDWLGKPSNDSVFTGMNRGGDGTITVRKQLESYEKDIEGNYATFWFKVIAVINDGFNLGYNKAEVKAVITHNVPQMTTAFRGLISEHEIESFATESFDEVWEAILPS